MGDGGALCRPLCQHLLGLLGMAAGNVWDPGRGTNPRFEVALEQRPSSRRVRHVGIRNERQCSIKNLDACPWSYRFRREMPAKGARARYTAKQPKDMARDGRQAHALVKLASHIGDESRNGGLR